MEINGDLEFGASGGEIKTAVMEKLTTAARTAITTPVAGRLAFDTDTGSYYYGNGSVWVAFSAGGGDTVAIQAEINAIETASGGIFDTDGTFDGTGADALGNVTGSSSLLNILTQLDAAITAAAVVVSLDDLFDVDITSVAGNDVLVHDGASWKNVDITTVGSPSFKQITTDNSFILASTPNADMSVVGASGGGLYVNAAPGVNTLTLSMTPIDLVSTVVVAPADYVILSKASDTVNVSPVKTKLDDIVKSLNIVSNITSNGMVTRTADDTYASRAIATVLTQDYQGLNVTNADGVAGNPTIGLDILSLPNVDGIMAAGSQFVFHRTAGGGGNKRISIESLRDNILHTTAGGGVAVDDLSDATITTLTDNDFFIYDSGATEWVNTNVADTLTILDVYTKAEADTNFVDVTGDTMTGDLAMGTNLITGLGAPVSANDAANKSYVDALTAGLTWKNSAIVASTANIDLATGTLLTVDGVLLVAGDRVVVKDQTVTADNGVYIAAVGAWARATDFDEISPIDEINSAAIFVQQGSTTADTGWTVTTNVDTLGTDSLVFTQFTGASGVGDGVGLSKSGNTLNINMGAGVVALPGDEVGIDLYTDGGLILTDSLNGSASVLTAAKLQVLLDGSTLSMSATGVKVAASGVTSNELATSVAGAGIVGGAGVPLAVNTNGASGITISGDEVILATIPNTSLQNGGINLAADSGSAEVCGLGETLTILGDGNIETTTSAVNTITLTIDMALDDLSDTNLGSPTAGDVVVWNEVAGEWQAGNPINSSSELTDVTAAASAAGEILVSDGSGDYTPRQLQFVDTQASATTWTVTHNLNQKFVNVTVYDSSDNVVIPQTIVATSSNVTTVTFNVAIAGTVSVMGAYGLAAV